jgi:hypothetical protein
VGAAADAGRGQLGSARRRRRGDAAPAGRGTRAARTDAAGAECGVVPPAPGWYRGGCRPLPSSRTTARPHRPLLPHARLRGRRRGRGAGHHARAWKGSPRSNGAASLKTWLYRIATNVCLDALAASGRRRPPPQSTCATCRPWCTRASSCRRPREDGWSPSPTRSPPRARRLRPRRARRAPRECPARLRRRRSSNCRRASAPSCSSRRCSAGPRPRPPRARHDGCRR